MGATQRSSKPEVGDVFRLYGPEYIMKHKLPLHSLKTVKAIERCRTSELGGHTDKCDRCGYLRISYNSCRNRHCPKCQTLSKERWLENRKKNLLPVNYFHLVFTIPSELYSLVLINQQTLYTLLFKAVAHTIRKLARDKRHLGAETGFIAILHTWGQNLMQHPHLHCIIPAGGLSFDGRKWITSNKKFFMPVKVLSRLFRGIYLDLINTAYENKELVLTGSIEYLKLKKSFKQLLGKLYGKEWVVYAKQPFGGPKQVLGYLGRYTHRVAISNNRIVKLQDGKVFFSWRDYRDKNKTKTMALDADEFIRRFLLHVLPWGFFKIRYYGLLSSKNHRPKLLKCKMLLGINAKPPEDTIQTWQEIFLHLTGINVLLCPECKKGTMVLHKSFKPGKPPHI
jgi:hypothetical protein